MSARNSVSHEAVNKHGGDVFAALRQHQHDQVMSLTDFQMALYIMAREGGDDHPQALDFAVDGPFKEATK